VARLVDALLVRAQVVLLARRLLVALLLIVPVMGPGVAGQLGQHLGSGVRLAARGLVGAAAQQLLLLATVPLVRVVGGLGQAVGEVEEILGDADGAEEVELRLGLVEDLVGEELLDALADGGHIEDLIAAGAHSWSDLDEALDGLGEIVGEVARDLGVHAAQHLLVEPLHVLGAEGWFKSDGFIEHTTKRPDIGLMIVRLIPPDFRTRIVRSTSLRI